MSDAIDTTFASPPPAPQPRRSVVPTLLAWLVILGLVTFYVLRRDTQTDAARDKAEDRVGLLVMRMQARYFLGVRALLGPRSIYEQAKALNTGTVEQRLRFIVLAGELAGPTEPLAQLHHLDQLLARQGQQLTPAQAAVRDSLERLYRDYERLRWNAPSVARAERERLLESLGWFGELALAPPTPAVAVAGGLAGFVLERDAIPDAAARTHALAPAQRTTATILAAFGSGCLLGLAGVVGLIVFVVLVLKGKVSGNLHSETGNGGVYAETFALWLVLFAAFSFVGALLPADWPRLPLGGAAMLLSLAALAWPVLRGVSWREVRADVGLTLGRRPAVEPWCGVCCYGLALPLLGVGFLLTLLLLLVERALGGNGEVSFRPSGGPSHPIVEVVARGDLFARLEVLFLACVVAPLVEETMFRGVLYRHLREATARCGPAWSFLLSATVVSFLFAVIHPQGLIAVPVLMALAYGFTIAREWRGSLVGSMVGHGLNNGLVMIVTMLAMGD